MLNEFPVELTPRPKMTKSQLVAYVEIVRKHPRVHAFNDNATRYAAPGDTVKLEFETWKRTFHVLIIDDDYNFNWDIFDDLRVVWEKELVTQ